MIKYKIALLLVLAIFALSLCAQQVSAAGDFKFDFATKVAGIDNYTKHWSNVYPPDPKASIIIYSYAGNMSYKRLSAVSFVYVVYDPFDNIVAVEQLISSQRSYQPNVVYLTLHPKSDWIDGNYKVKIVVFDKIDRDAWEEIKNDPYGISSDPEKYKTFYESGSNAEDLGVVKDIGDPVAQAVINFKINKSASMYPPDRFLLHDVRFSDNITERILGEKLKIEVKVDNNYIDDGTFKLGMLVNNSLVSTQDIKVQGLNTSKIIFDATAGKIGTFKLSFAADTSDLKFRNAEMLFSIKNGTETTRLEVTKIEITGMNVNKEFTGVGGSITVSVTAINNGRAGSKNITVYSNKVPVGSAEINLQPLEEKTVEIPVSLKNMGLNRITVSDAPQLYRNVFVQESDESAVDGNPVVERLKENPVKVSAVVVFLVFGVTLYYLRKRLFDEEVLRFDIPAREAEGRPEKNRLSDMREYLVSKIQSIKSVKDKKPKP